MTFEEPTEPTTAPARKSGRAVVINVLRWILIALVVAAAVWQLWVNWEAVAFTIGDLQWHRTTLSFIAVIVGMACATLSWQVLLDDLGKPIGFGRGAQIFLVGQLGKYLPGSIWAYVLQIELGNKAGLARARTFAATLFSVVIAVFAALVCGSVAIPSLMASDPRLSWLPWLYIVLPFAAILLWPPVLTAIVRIGFRILRRPRPDHPVTLSVVAKSLGLAIGSYLAFGTHLWLLADTRQGLTINPWALCVGTMAVAMLAGLAFFLLPSGVGARELVIIAALTPIVGVGPATAYAAVSRVMFILADLLTAGTAAGMAVIARRRLGPYTGDPDPGPAAV
ncbi:lysylphosphatidylglycerol synthase domain-containing protein [Microbacterium immunditiarum]|uniref:Flippase-like domain-containing protein n=1 Tax=Microbacterium immunditiarum TaxID=337480 RepID=A0A7Y9GR17_9MICO|nr:hypothetical protein [Microbacterium immunditiarum]